MRLLHPTAEFEPPCLPEHCAWIYRPLPARKPSSKRGARRRHCGGLALQDTTWRNSLATPRIFRICAFSHLLANPPSPNPLIVPEQRNVRWNTWRSLLLCFLQQWLWRKLSFPLLLPKTLAHSDNSLLFLVDVKPSWNRTRARHNGLVRQNARPTPRLPILVEPRRRRRHSKHGVRLRFRLYRRCSRPIPRSPP